MKEKCLILLIAIIGINCWSQSLDTIDKKYTSNDKIKMMSLQIDGSQKDNFSLYPFEKTRDDVSVDFHYKVKNTSFDIMHSLFAWKYFTPFINKKDMIDENSIIVLFSTMFTSNLLGSEDYKRYKLRTIDYPQDFYKKAFNADYGFSVFFESNPKQNIKEKYVQVISYVKKGFGVVFITICGNDIEEFKNLNPRFFRVFVFV
jgi:hypothetical protein